jgi:hypothetical protein
MKIKQRWDNPTVQARLRTNNEAKEIDHSNSIIYVSRVKTACFHLLGSGLEIVFNVIAVCARFRRAKKMSLLHMAPIAKSIHEKRHVL